LRLTDASGRKLESFAAAPVTWVEPGMPISIPVTVTHEDAAAPLELSYTFDGQYLSLPVDLTPRAIGHATKAGVSLSRPRAGTSRFVEPRERTEERRAISRLRRVDATGAQSLTRERTGLSTNARTITVTGRIHYTRGDGADRPADGVRVEVFDEDEVWDEYLDGGLTEPDGTFSMTFTWDPWPWQDDRPDLLIYYETINSHVQVQTSNIIEDNYNWETGVVDDYEGSDLDFGDISPGDNGEHVALDLCTQVTREWRWFNDVQGYDVPTVDVQWPEPGTGAFYLDDFEEIHICSDRNWREDTIFHEYGHHWVTNYAAEGYEDPPYCNGFCDNPPCGHCLWCKETPEIAFGEGFPNWIASIVGRWTTATYDPQPFRARGMDSLANCTVDRLPHPPDSTEGHFSALVRDIDDAGQDDNNPANAWIDRVSLGAAAVLAVVDEDHPLTPNHFMLRMKAHYPELAEDLWETGKDIGYEVDVDGPGAPTGVSSSSHPNGLPTTVAIFVATWTRPTDDWSGVGGYSVSFTSDVPALPNTTQEIGNVTSYTSAVLAPGSWYFNIRAMDRAGRWSASYAAYGPFNIRAPDPVDLQFRLALGWDWFIMPRPTNDATANNVQNPDSLNGNCSCTYWNYAGQNSGEVASGATSYSRLIVDGAYKTQTSLGSIAAGGAWSHINRGPVNIRGGRHTFEVDLDGTGVLAESDETDNAWAEQWIWSPLALTAGTTLTRTFPPDRTGGWDAMDPDDPLYYNSDGFRFTTSGWWNAVSIRGLNDWNDWDCRLHVASTGPADGFTSNAGWSSRAAGCLDAVLVNKNLTGSGSWDVGVVDYNTSAVSAQYSIVQTVSQTHSFGTEVVIPFAQDGTIALREFYVSVSDIGWVEIVATTDTPGDPIRVRWFDASFDRGDLDDYDATMTTDENGTARMNVNALGSGYNCVVVFRDPHEGLEPVNVTLRIGKAPPDLHAFSAPGWYAPLTPRAAADGIPGLVPMPDTLYGNIASTYLNYAVTNTGLGDASSVLNRVYLDGVLGFSTSYASLPSTGINLTNSPTARTIRGGRHTLSMVLDPLGAIYEADETNNAEGQQWVWGALPLTLGASATRTVPPDPDGGFVDAGNDEPLVYNSDGLRTPVYAPAGSDGWWAGAAVMPGPGANVDARLHEAKTGAKLGFESSYAGSYWGTDQSDFVLADLRETALRTFDVGVILGGAVLGNYTAQAVASIYRGASPAGDFGPFTIGPNQILDLHEFWLSAGRWTFRVMNTAGTVDWGMTLHPAGTPYLSKSMAADSGSAWYAPAGENESITAVVPADGYYCLAVWKARTASLGLSGSYLLKAGVATVAVNDPTDVPARTALAAAYPNPFGGSTNVVFDLARGGDVSLEVFDIRGALVRTLARGAWPAGRHSVIWDGRSDRGTRVSGGVYLVRFSAGGVMSARKVARLE
jgi:hypothetical protein